MSKEKEKEKEAVAGPLLGHPLQKLLGDQFLRRDGSQVTFGTSHLKEKRLVGVLFSASWCKKPCYKFSLLLKKVYGKLPPNQLEIVFATRDETELVARDYFTQNHGDWLAVPFGSPVIGSLKKLWKVKRIPELVVLDGETGNIVDLDGVETMTKLEHESVSRWTKAPLVSDAKTNNQDSKKS